MTSIHIKDVINHFKPHDEPYFLEIMFNDNNRTNSTVIDEEFKDKVIAADSESGSIVIIFDRLGQLRSLEIC